MSALSSGQAEAIRRMSVFERGTVISAEFDDGIAFVDVLLAPADVTVTVEQAVPANCLYRLPKEGELLLCGFVDGDYNDGIVMQSLDSESNTAPGEMDEDTVYLWVPAGESLVIKATGSGKVSIEADEVVVNANKCRLNSADIYLGEGAADKVVTESRFKAQWNAFFLQYKAHTHQYIWSGGTGVTIAGPDLIAATPGMNGIGSDTVRAK